jgi:hypothetical protein
MTTPNERLRCLAWGQALLQEIERDESVRIGLRVDAKELLASHPSSEDFHALVKARATMLSNAQSGAIQAARNLFEAVQRDGQGHEDTLRFVLFTLRHYPPKVLAAAWARGFYPSIDDWLSVDV